MLDKFYEDVMKKPKKEKIYLNLSNNVLINPGVLPTKLSNIDNLTDRDLYELINNSYNILLNDTVVNDNKYYLSLFTNSRFLSIFIQVTSSVIMNHTNRVFCNRIAYDYLTSTDPDPYIVQLFYTLSKMVNRDVIPQLIGIGLSEDLASYMALTRYSTQKEMVNVKRLNFIIIQSPKELMTEQRIVWIYEKLFDRFTPLFEGTMFDIYSDIDHYTEDMEEIYSIISLAILDIMNEMASADIRKVLISYSGDYNFRYRKGERTSRFSMQSLAEDFYRINQVVEALVQENIIVP